MLDKNQLYIGGGSMIITGLIGIIVFNNDSSAWLANGMALIGIGLAVGKS